MLFPALIFAQDESSNFTIKNTQSLRDGMSTGLVRVIGDDGTYIYCSRLVKWKSTIEKYSMTDLTLIGSGIDPNEDVKNSEVIGTYMLGGSPTIISRFFDNKLNKYNFYSHRLDPEKMVFLPSVKIFERAITEGSSRASNAFGEVTVTSSKDYNFMVVSYNDYTEKISPEDVTKKKFNQKLNLFDRNGDIKATSDFKLPYDNFSITEKAVSNDGVFYVIGFAIVGDADAGTRKRKDFLVSYDIEKDLQKVVEIEIADNYAFASSMHFMFAENGQILVSGITNKKIGDDKKAYGCLLTGFDKNLNQTSNYHTELETDFEGAGFGVKRIINRPDGSALILAEKFYASSQTSTNSSGIQSTITSYHYDDIVAVNFTSAGEADWVKVIEKRQLSKGSDQYANANFDPTRYSSFSVMVQDDAVIIIYNQPKAYYDDPIGANIVALKMVDKESEIIVATLDVSGNLSKNRLLESGNELCVITSSFRNFSNGKAYFCATSLSDEQIFSIAE